jgi:hypothetical protein
VSRRDFEDSQAAMVSSCQCCRKVGVWVHQQGYNAQSGIQEADGSFYRPACSMCLVPWHGVDRWRKAGVWTLIHGSCGASLRVAIGGQLATTPPYQLLTVYCQKAKFKWYGLKRRRKRVKGSHWIRICVISVPRNCISKTSSNSIFYKQ